MEKRPCGCPEGDICCKCCDCECHLPDKFARLLKNVRESGAGYLRPVNAALDRLDTDDWSPKFKLVFAVWDKLIDMKMAKQPTQDERIMLGILGQAVGKHVVESAWRANADGKMKEKFGTADVFLAYTSLFKKRDKHGNHHL